MAVAPADEKKAAPANNSATKLERLASLYNDIKEYGHDIAQSPEDKETGKDLALNIGKTQAKAGVEVIDKLDTELSKAKLNELVKLDKGGLPDEKRQRHGAVDANNKIVENFRGTIATNLVSAATTAIAAIKDASTKEIKRFESDNHPDAASWNAAFAVDEKNTFNNNVDAQIQELKNAKDDTAATGAEKRDLIFIYENQIKSLENLKKEFNDTIDKYQNETVLKAMMEVKHAGGSPSAVPAVAAPGTIPRATIIEEKIREKSHDKKGADIEAYARVARTARANIVLADRSKKGWLTRWTTVEKIEIADAMNDRLTDYVRWGETLGIFNFTDTGIHFKTDDSWCGSGVKEINIETVLDAFWAATGHDHAILTADERVSFAFLEKIADVVQKRQGVGDANPRPEHPKKPTVELDPKTVDMLIDKLVKDGKGKVTKDEATEKVRVLNAKLMGEAPGAPGPDGKPTFNKPLPAAAAARSGQQSGAAATAHRAGAP